MRSALKSLLAAETVSLNHLFVSNANAMAAGMFEFDLCAPIDYPQVPPKMQFRTTGGGIAHFNPNLYPCGKICLSLLGT